MLDIIGNIGRFKSFPELQFLEGLDDLFCRFYMFNSYSKMNQGCYLDILSLLDQELNNALIMSYTYLNQILQNFRFQTCLHFIVKHA